MRLFRSIWVKDGDSLFGQASRALGWSLVNTIVGRLSTLAIGIVLARLLGPVEFGTFAVAMVALLAVLSFNELGVSLAIVRWPGDPKEIAPTVATISVASSCLIYIACFLGAPSFAEAMGNPQAAPVVRLLALNVLVSGVVAAPAAMLQRHFRQDRKAIADQVNSWLGTLVSIALAVAGWGAMSLAVGRLVGAAGSAVLYIGFAPGKLRLGFDRAVARRLLRFGLPLAGSSIVVFLVGNLDQFVVGHVLGATALGFYVLAFNLSNWPVSVFSQPVRSVAPAAFARLQHDPRALRGAFTSTAGLLVAVTVPVCLLLAGAAAPLVRFVYGPVWEPAASALVWLAVFGALRIAFELVYDYFVVLAHSRVVFTVQVIWLVLLAPALVFAVRAYGFAGGGIAHVAVAVLVILPIYLRELGRVGIRARDLAASVAPGLAGGLLAGLAAALIAWLIAADLVALLAAGSATMAVVAALIYLKRSALRGLRGAGAGVAEAVT
ncbi:lipopolysaccharide biosynthesis protein [Planotetraspora sp. A-T 1434]|uniref:lipopolysaccharide biosynthesis protein n=1 Tax=Planotetraspora sp. A-T 1434 TaxID=2979219 RepID=UPI0021BE39F9|nr:lipopolysaccharide biosynthesis protein [Planotetraspora sp. A-T 1434]MCT9931977.1 lipopolysaccharide biosynthesis protein [Planotetraspora sp. A-T 1434]